MRRLLVFLAVLCLLPFAAPAENADAAADCLTLLPLVESAVHYGFVLGEGTIPYGHGQLSFSLEETGAGLNISISYFDKDGHTADEVLGWDVYLNDAEQPLRCGVWFTFPNGCQTNYTNPEPYGLALASVNVRLTPVLADELDPADFPEILAAGEASW